MLDPRARRDRGGPLKRGHKLRATIRISGVVDSIDTEIYLTRTQHLLSLIHI